MQDYAHGKYRLAIMTRDAAYSDKLRDLMARDAMQIPCDYIFWIDADQTYPPDSPERLMKHIDSGKLVVGGLVPHRGNGLPNVYMAIPGSPLYRHRKVYEGEGVIKVDAMGLGGVMMNPEVFRKMEYPWFRQYWDESIKDALGMDFTFYKNCARAGIDVWCDTSLVYGHLALKNVPLTIEKRMIL